VRLWILCEVLPQIKIASEMPGIGANNASTLHIAITGKQTVMNHESFRKRTESLVQHFT
jgi:hypothetical protein